MSKKQSLIDIQAEITAAKAEVEEATNLNLDTQDGERELEVLFKKLENKTRGIDMFIDRIDMEIEQHNTMIKSYNMLVKAHRDKATILENTKKRILAMFKIAGLVAEGKNYKTDVRTYYLKKTEVLVEPKQIPDNLPEEYKTTEIIVKPNKAKIKRDILDGKDIEGYSIQYNDNVIRR